MAQVKDPMSGSDQRSSTEIRNDIRRTRAEMDATVDAIEQKLSPGELIHEAWGLFRGGSSSSVNRIWKIAKQHPMPTAIIGLGLGWMAYESSGGNELATRGSRSGGAYAGDHRWRQEAGDLADDAGDMGSDVAGSVRRAAETAGDVASDLSHSVRRQASDLGRQASELGGQARQGMQQAGVGFWETLEQQPFVVGVATLAAGLLVGLLVPSTPREDELMGKARDSLLDEIKGLGYDAVEKGKQVASAAANTLKQAAEVQGVSAESMADTLRTVSRDVVESVKSEAEKQNLTVATTPSGESAPPRQESPQSPKHRAA